MNVAEISSASVEYIRVLVAATANGAAIAPTADAVTMAFLASTATGTAPASGDWRSASWDVDSVSSPTRYRAQCLVGPTGGGGTGALTAGLYEVWLKITDSPEVPVVLCGLVRVI